MSATTQERLSQKAKIWAKKLGEISCIRAIFLSGSVAQGRSTDSSDIDFFIIAKSGQIWTARFLVFLKLKLGRQITTPHHHAGKICPNHFISDNSLKIREKDSYSANLFSQNVPLYDPDGIFLHFAQINQPWVIKFKESFDSKYLKTSMTPFEIKTPNFLAKNIEKFLKMQVMKIKANPDFKKRGAKIVTTDKELRFHPKPKNLEWDKK